MDVRVATEIGADPLDDSDGATAADGRVRAGASDEVERQEASVDVRPIAYERLLYAIHNENATDQYFVMGRRLGRLLYEGKWFDPEAMMLKDALTRWIAPSITGRVTLELRRGDDYTIVSTAAEHMAYDPHKLSMEKVEGLFSPEDRMGALEMQNLSVLDTRNLHIAHLDATRVLAGAGPAPRELTEILGDSDE